MLGKREWGEVAGVGSAFSKFFFYYLDSGFFFKYLFATWQPHQHLTDQWMENVTDV